MKNAVGRDIPEALLVNGREVYQGKNYMDGKYLQKAAPCTRRYERPQESKIVETLADALRQCGAKDGMTFSFHHHLRNGDYVVNMVMKAAIEELGLKELTIAATSLGEAHDPIAEYIEEGKDEQGKGYDPRKLLAPGFEAIKATVKEKMEIFGSVGKA